MPETSRETKPKIRSGVEAIDWPPLPSVGASALLVLLDQFEDSERWPHDLLRAVQYRQLTQLVGHARTTAPFWRRRLDGAGYLPGEPVTAANWAKLPILTRAELQKAGEALYSTAPPAAHGRLRDSAPLGGPGSTAKIKVPQLVDTMRWAFEIRHRLWHGYDFSARRAVILSVRGPSGAFPDGAHHDGWDPQSDSAFETGSSAELNVDTPVPDQADWLKREDPDYLLTSNANLYRLVRHARDHGLRLAALRAVETARGLPTPELRDLVRNAWNVPVHGSLGLPETGPVALQCPAAEHYHAAAESALVEVLDGNGDACAPGETGRVVVTPLHNFATPLLRFDTGHRAELGAPDCPCGRTLPVLARVFAPEAR